MDKDEEVRTCLQKLEKIVPYWIKHNREHIDEHRKWMEDAGRLGLAGIAAELTSVIELLEKTNKHLDLINQKINMDK